MDRREAGKKNGFQNERSSRIRNPWKRIWRTTRKKHPEEEECFHFRMLHKTPVLFGRCGLPAEISVGIVAGYGKVGVQTVFRKEREIRFPKNSAAHPAVVAQNG